MVTEAYQFQTNGLAKFAQMVPDGGFAGCGDDLYALVTDTGTGAVTSLRPAVWASVWFSNFRRLLCHILSKRQRH